MTRTKFGSDFSDVEGSNDFGELDRSGLSFSGPDCVGDTAGGMRGMLSSPPIACRRSRRGFLIDSDFSSFIFGCFFLSLFSVAIPIPFSFPS
jgi:hypothetical protein